MNSFNKTTLLYCVAVAIMVTVATFVPADEKAALVVLPLQGVVTQGRALACNDGVSKGGDVFLFHASLKGGPISKSPSCAVEDGRPCLWHVGFGHLWASNNLDDYHSSLGSSNHNDDRWGRYRLDDLLRGKLITRQGTPENDQMDDFMPAGGPLSYAADIYEWVKAGNDDQIDEQFEFYKFHLHYDYLPVSQDELRLFQLCNVYGADQGCPAPTAESDNLVLQPLPEHTDKEYQKPSWSLGVFRFRAAWDADKKQWGNGTWKREGSIAVGFKEAFRAMGKGDDYYFATASGKVYHAPKPAKGKDRKMEVVWDDAKRPVVSFITDADADRTFLFCKPDKEGKGVYFEMGAKPDPQSYDAAKIPEAKPDDPLPAVLAYARLLVADKKIKSKE